MVHSQRCLASAFICAYFCLLFSGGRNLMAQHAEDWRMIEALMTKQYLADTNLSVGPTMSVFVHRQKIHGFYDVALLETKPGDPYSIKSPLTYLGPINRYEITDGQANLVQTDLLGAEPFFPATQPLLTRILGAHYTEATGIRPEAHQAYYVRSEGPVPRGRKYQVTIGIIGEAPLFRLLQQLGPWETFFVGAISGTARPFSAPTNPLVAQARYAVFSSTFGHVGYAENADHLTVVELTRDEERGKITGAAADAYLHRGDPLYLWGSKQAGNNGTNAPWHDWSVGNKQFVDLGESLQLSKGELDPFGVLVAVLDTRGIPIAQFSQRYWPGHIKGPSTPIGQIQNSMQMMMASTYETDQLESHFFGPQPDISFLNKALTGLTNEPRSASFSLTLDQTHEDQPPSKIQLDTSIQHIEIESLGIPSESLHYKHALRIKLNSGVHLYLAIQNDLPELLNRPIPFGSIDEDARSRLPAHFGIMYMNPDLKQEASDRAIPYGVKSGVLLVREIHTDQAGFITGITAAVSFQTHKLPLGENANKDAWAELQGKMFIHVPANEMTQLCANVTRPTDPLPPRSSRTCFTALATMR